MADIDTMDDAAPADDAAADGRAVLAAAAAALQIACDDEVLAAAAVGASECAVRFDADGNATVVAGGVEAPVAADLIARHLGLETDDSADDDAEAAEADALPAEE